MRESLLARQHSSLKCIQSRPYQTVIFVEDRTAVSRLPERGKVEVANVCLSTARPSVYAPPRYTARRAYREQPEMAVIFVGVQAR
jgi:hypothetical protein